MRKPGWQEYHDSIRESQFSLTDLVWSLGIWHCLGVPVTLRLCIKYILHCWLYMSSFFVITLRSTDEEEFNVWKKLYKEGICHIFGSSMITSLVSSLIIFPF